MNGKPLLTGEELFKLFPQRKPIVMVDTFFAGDNTGAETGLHITVENIFCSDGKMRETGLIEHIAQSAAAFAGYAPYTRGEAPKLGFIGEIKRLSITRLPAIGEFLHTHLHVLGEAYGVTLISAETFSEDQTTATEATPIAACQMKIFIKEDENGVE